MFVMNNFSLDFPPNRGWRAHNARARLRLHGKDGIGRQQAFEINKVGRSSEYDRLDRHGSQSRTHFHSVGATALVNGG